MLSAIVGAWIAYNLYAYTKRRDKTELFRSMWESQQELNLLLLVNDEEQGIFEGLVYGDDGALDIKTAKIYTLLFLIINRIQNYYFAWKNGIFRRSEFRKYAIATLSLVHNQRDTINYLLDERGYTSDFAAEVRHLLRSTHPPAPPTKPAA